MYLWCYWEKVAFAVLRGAWVSPLPDSSTAVMQGPRGFSPSPQSPVLHRAPPEGWQLGSELTVGNYGGSMFVEKQHCVLGGVGGKSCWKRWLVCLLMLTRLILFIYDLVEIPKHPKDKVWKLCCKLVPLKSKQTMNPWFNYSRNFPDFSAIM